MTLDQIAAFQRRILTEIYTGRIAPRAASAIDRALRKRLKAIEREGGLGGNYLLRPKADSRRWIVTATAFRHEGAASSTDESRSFDHLSKRRC